MPVAIRETNRRRELLRSILERHRVTTQEQLLGLLAEEGLNTTQATLSRDLRLLGIAKTETGYVLPPAETQTRGDAARLIAAMRECVRHVVVSGTFAVIHVRPGTADKVATELVEARLPQVLGTFVSGDSLLVPTQTTGQARELVRLIRKWAKLARIESVLV